MPHTIFYSWQSDLPNSTNRGFVQDALEQAVANLAKDSDVTVEPVLDRDTAGVAGAPDIAQTIFSKIENATAFVCDVSIINSQSTTDRPTPNPNVLIELGFALKTMGQSKILMVMNTEYGKPELLPFDLKQKRVVTYKAGKTDADKSNVKRSLVLTLAAAIKTILVDVQKDTAIRQPALTPADQAVEAIKEAKPYQGRAIAEFMVSLGKELKALDPHDLPGEADENLVQALDKTVPLVQEFEKVADAISAVNSEEAARVLFKGFENIMTLCYLPQGFSGHFKTIDFDLFKFITNELFVIFIAHLMKDERWKILDGILKRTLHVPNARPEDTLLTFHYLSDHVALLDEIRNRRLVTDNKRRISMHADILKQRHESGPLAQKLTWTDFLDADILLFLRGFIGSENGTGTYWWPRTAVYSGSHSPRYLVEAKAPQGAAHLKMILGLKTNDVREHVQKALTFLATGLRQMGSHGGFGYFNAGKIADPEEQET